MYLIAFSEDFWSRPSVFGVPLGIFMLVAWAVSVLKQGQGAPQTNDSQRKQLKKSDNLRAELQQKRIRLAELKLKAAKTSNSECPYCFGPIHKDAVKCRHCASDIGN